MRHVLIEQHRRLAAGHGLQQHAARAADLGVEQALAAEEHVLHALDLADIQRAALVHHRDIAGVHDLLVSRGDLILDGRAVDLHEHHARAAEAVHEEALATEQAAANALLHEDRALNVAVVSQKRSLLHDDRALGRDLDGHDGARKMGGKCDLTVAVRDVVV